MLKGTLWIDQNTLIQNFNGLFEIFASEVYINAVNISDGWNQYENNLMLLSASLIVINNSDFNQISNINNEILFESISLSKF